MSFLLRSLRTSSLSNFCFSGRKLPSTVAFDWEDPLNSKALFTSEELDIQETARPYCQERLLPKILDAFRDEHDDPNILREMWELGLLGATISSHGCAGVSSIASGLITREVGRVYSGYRSGMSVQSSLVMGYYLRAWHTRTEGQVSAQASSGNYDRLFRFDRAPPWFGPWIYGDEARPHPTKKGCYSISRAKTWITNSPIADLVLVWAKLENTGKIRGFLIERDQCPSGTLKTPVIKDKNGLRASITVEGLRGPFSCLNSVRYGIAFGAMGALEDCIDRAQTYALDRKQFKNNPIAKYQLVQKKLSDALTDATYGVLAAIRVGRLKDQGIIVPEMVSMIKRQKL